MKILPTWKMSQKSSSTNPKPEQRSETFFLFKSFPREIRNNIYSFALNGDKPRVTEVTYSKNKLDQMFLLGSERLRCIYKFPRWCMAEKANSHSKKPIKDENLNFRTRSFHPLFHTCRESRAEISRLYPIKNSSKHDGQRGGNSHLPFNTNLDILQFGSIYEGYPWRPANHPRGNPISDQELRRFVTSQNQEHIFQNVKNLMISVSIWRRLCKTQRSIRDEIPSQLLLPFRSLEKLIIIMPWEERKNVRKHLKRLKKAEREELRLLEFSIMPASIYFTEVIEELKEKDPAWSCPGVELWLPRRDGSCVPFSVAAPGAEDGSIQHWFIKNEFLERFLDGEIVERLADVGAAGV